MRTAFFASLMVGVLALSACGEEDFGVLADDVQADDVQADDDPLPVETYAAQPDCPTASESASLSIWWWRTRRELTQFVWSSDGSRVTLLENTYEEKKNWWPWATDTDKRRFCHRIYTQNLDGSNKQLLGLNELRGHDLFDMKPAGYLVVEAFDTDGNLQIHRWPAAGGARTLLAKTPDTCSYARVIPSPDGARMAQILVAQPCGSVGDPSTPTKVTVQMLKASGAKIGGANVVNTNGFIVPVWTLAGDFVVTNFTTASAFGEDGQAPVATAVPTCTDPPTTSSRTNAAGQMLDIVGNQPGVAVIAPDRAFGCGL
jgi:hypothetical protein